MAEEQQKKGMERKYGVCFLVIVLLIGALLYVLVYRQMEGGGQVVVSVSGKEVERLRLNQDLTKEIKGRNGGTNLLVIKGGRVRVEDASCPDHLCVKKNAISRTGESIICLPNQVVITVEKNEEEESGVDAIAR